MIFVVKKEFFLKYGDVLFFFFLVVNDFLILKEKL